MNKFYVFFLRLFLLKGNIDGYDAEFPRASYHLFEWPRVNYPSNIF